ncbi:MAG: hypothetical protein NW201_04700, partial [Gemmatimonadales bacterium]|nr:hypothetical protein [Gemmatimonadales bacterium]
MAPDLAPRSRRARLGALLLLFALAGLAGACGGGEGGGEEDGAPSQEEQLARARIDSMRKVRKQKDSLATARRAACADSVVAALKKSPGGRKVLEAKLPPGEELPPIVQACGPAKGMAPAPAVAAAPAAAKPGAPAPAPAAQPPAP